QDGGPDDEANAMLAAILTALLAQAEAPSTSAGGNDA
ncbi:hypothetical protein FHR71_005192, partial [Methylobacterium sp. RAS18]|nr:hypothetical protein [Methylobacterium sp. RAS18]